VQRAVDVPHGLRLEALAAAAAGGLEFVVQPIELSIVTSCRRTRPM